MTATLRDAYEALLGIAMRQRAALEAEDFDAFEQAGLEREIAFEAVQRQASAALDGTEKAEVAALIRRVLEADDALEALMEQKRAAATSELSTLQNGLSALQSYLPVGNGSAYFIDQSS